MPAEVRMCEQNNSFTVIRQAIIRAIDIGNVFFGTWLFNSVIPRTIWIEVFIGVEDEGSSEDHSFHITTKGFQIANLLFCELPFCTWTRFQYYFSHDLQGNKQWNTYNYTLIDVDKVSDRKLEKSLQGWQK